MTKTIEITRNDGVVLVRLNRPKQLNALNMELKNEILAELPKLDKDPSVRCFVITGSDKAFAAGGDIKKMSVLSYAEAAMEDYFADWDVFVNLRTPKIAAVNGYALGGGCELAMMCDFIIAGEGAQFGQPEIKLGVIAGMGGSQRMTKLIGRAKSMDMHLTGRMMLADEALACGLVARVVPDDQVVETAMTAGAQIADYSKPVTALVRDVVNRADETSLTEGLLFERRVFHSLFATHDQKEGMNAFIEKRKAVFEDK